MFCGLTVPSFRGSTRGLSEKPIVSRNATATYDKDSARQVAPDDVASARPALAALLDHPLRLGLDKIEQRIAVDADQAARLEQCFDLLRRPAAEERQPIADRRIFGTGTGILRRLHQKPGVELAIDDDETPARPQHANPLVDRRLRMRQRPQNVAADREVEAVGRERQLLGVGLLEADREILLRRLAPRFGQHRGGDIDADDPMTASRQLKAQETGAATGVERIERVPPVEDEN